MLQYRRENKNYKLIPYILQGIKSIGMPKHGTATDRIMYNGVQMIKGAP